MHLDFFPFVILKEPKCYPGGVPMLAKIGVKILFSKYLTLRLHTKSYINVFIIEMHLDFFPFEILKDPNAILEESQCWTKFCD